MLSKLRAYLHWGLLGLIALVALVLGLFGWYAELAGLYPDPEKACALVWPHDWLTVIYRTVLLYPAEVAGFEVSEDNVALQVARILAPIATLGVLFRTVAEILSKRIEQWVIRGQKGHVVVCGLGARGAAFALDRREAGYPVVVIDREPNEAAHKFCEAHDIHLLEGDCQDTAILRLAAVPKAKAIILTTGNDGENLVSAMNARTLLTKSNYDGAGLKAYLVIKRTSLWREIVDSGLIDRRDEKFEIVPVSLPVLSSRLLLWNEPLYSFADILNQRRVHAVLIGLDSYGESLLIQIARVCVYKDFEKTVVSILHPDPIVAEQMIRRHLPELDEAVCANFIKFDPDAHSLSPELLKSISEVAPITAFFVCIDDDDRSLATALYVQKVMRLSGCVSSPVFFRESSSEGIEGLLCDTDSAKCFGDVFSAFGVINSLCRLDLIDGQLEAVAEKFHEDYQTTRNLIIDSAYDPARAESAQSWKALPETYRESNRRAADHIGAKIASVGAWRPRGVMIDAAKEFSLLNHPEALPALARLEHRRWCMGRYLDGWRLDSERDNRRKLHNNLVHFDMLDRDTQKYDEDQIIGLDKRIIEREDDSTTSDGLIRQDIWIGLIGRNHISVEEDAWVAEVLQSDVLPKLFERHAGSLFTFVSPLAPGLDLTMARAAVEAAQAMPHRLIVIEGVPEAAMVRNFLDNMEGVRSGVWGSQSGQGTDGDQSSVMEKIVDARQNLMQSTSTEWIVDLSESEVDYVSNSKARERGYKLANNYIIDKCPILIAATDQNAEAKPGGTVQAMQQFLDQQGKSHGWPVSDERSLILLDTRSRGIETKEC